MIGKSPNWLCKKGHQKKGPPLKAAPKHVSSQTNGV
jgi:hypothetical protein